MLNQELKNVRNWINKMTVAELIIELRKLDQSTEVWADTNVGLLPVDGLYFTDDTAIITYTDMLEEKVVH